jgi:hypothetical protein
VYSSPVKEQVGSLSFLTCFVDQSNIEDPTMPRLPKLNKKGADYVYFRSSNNQK